MSMELVGVHDGDSGPTYDFEIVDDDGATRDGATFAVEFKVEDEDGNYLATRPGILLSPKSGGVVRVQFKGSEADIGGAGGALVLKPKCYLAVAPGGALGVPAVSVLSNSSFDTDTTPADGVADSWTVSPATTGAYAVLGSGDAAPHAIFGSCQSVAPAAGTATEALLQDYLPGGGVLVGELWSAGVWFRGDRISGVTDDGHALILELRGTTPESIVSRFPVSSSDWRFYTTSMVATKANTTARLKLALNNACLGSRRFDDAFLFKGWWRSLHLEDIRLPVPGRARLAKSSNQIAGIGSFEQDSDADGLGDGWTKVGSLNTYALEADPTHVAHGSRSEKVTLGNGTAEKLYIRKRQRWKSGDVVKASIKVQTSGALAGAGGGGGFGLTVRGDGFDGGATQETATVAFGTNLVAFTTYTTQITLTADRDVIVLEVQLNGYTGTAWIDDAQLWR